LLRLTELQEKKIRELYKEYNESGLPKDFTSIVIQEFDIDITAKYIDIELRNPVIVAPGQLTLHEYQIELIAEAGYGAAVLKSVVGEDRYGNSSMAPFFRKKPTYIKVVYDPDDVGRSRPIILWDGGLDTRPLKEYLNFAANAIKVSSGLPLIASFLAHLPQLEEPWREDEWIYTASRLRELGYKHFEIDFCPFIVRENIARDRETVKRWYREATGIIKKGVPDAKVAPKIMNLNFGEDFQLEMIISAVEGKADGVVVANRFFRTDIGSPYGGRELKERNIRQIARARREGVKIPISGTGGVYSGIDILDYLKAGAENVQIHSMIYAFILEKRYEYTKVFKKVLLELMLNPNHGFIPAFLDLRNKTGIRSIKELVEIAKDEPFIK